MKRPFRVAAFPALIATTWLVSWPAQRVAVAGGPATIEAFLAPGYPTEIVSAKKADRIAWTAYYHELIVFTDDTHEPLLHSRYVYAFNRLEEFIGRFLKAGATRTTADGR